jgi:DNA-binding transcriptional LysR family regulator
MTVEGLKIFCDVVRQRSFSRGASLNAVSQSAASQAILQLEKRLGVRLIDRSKRPLTLTAEGRVYYEGCRDLVDQYFATEARTKALYSETRGHLIVASIYSVGIYDMHQYVRRFLDRHPGGNVRMDYLHPARVYEHVLNEEADLGLVSFPRSPRELAIVPWRDEPMVLVCHPYHRFASMPEVGIAQLSGEDYVAFDQDLAIRRQVDRYLRQRHVRANVVMEFDNIEAIKRGVEAGAGVSILPRPTVLREVANRSLALANLVGLDMVRPLSIIHRRGRVRTPAMTSFIELLTEQNGESSAAAGPDLATPSGNGRRDGDGHSTYAKTEQS